MDTSASLKCAARRWQQNNSTKIVFAAYHRKRCSMVGKRWMRVLMLGFAAAGATLLIYLLVRSDLPKVMAAIVSMGWGLLFLILLHHLPLFFDALCCGALFEPGKRPTVWVLFWSRWIGESVNIFLPSAQVGGDILRARLMMNRGTTGPAAVAAQLGDTTMSVVTQIVFTVLGVIALAQITHKQAFSTSAIIIGVLVAIGAVGGFYVVQRWGIFKLLKRMGEKMAHSKAWRDFGRNAGEIEEQVEGMYTRWRGLLISFLWAAASWASGIIEMYVALWALGLPADWGYAFAIEAAGQGVRSMFFMVPAGMGVQEGSYVMVGGMLGISAEGAMAIAISRRARELCFGLPALIAWPLAEGRGWGKSAGAKRDGTATATE
jgi:putative membrane protein